MSNFVGLAIGREWLGERLGVDVARQGAHALGPVEVLSGAPHSSIYKALSMVGLGRDAVRQVPVRPGREAVDVAALRDALAARRGPYGDRGRQRGHRQHRRLRRPAGDRRATGGVPVLAAR
nr:hypothetical protein GCM10020092_073260 [Actinoplanes digitatis]